MNDNDLFEENETILYTYILYYYKKFDIRVSEQIIKINNNNTSERENANELQTSHLVIDANQHIFFLLKNKLVSLSCS